MGRLRYSDLEALLAFIRESARIRDLEEFPDRILPALRRLIPCDIASYNEIDPRHGRAIMALSPADSLFPGANEIFERFMPQHPLIAYYNRTYDSHAFRISDFLSLREWMRSDLYDGFFDPLGLKRQLAVTLPSPPSLVIGIAFNRGSPDFTQRDRQLLDLLRPHLVDAYRAAESRTDLTARAAAFERALEEGRRAVIVATARGRVRQTTAQARRWLEAYFGHVDSDRLPDRIQAWAHAEQCRFAEPTELPQRSPPLVVSRGSRTLAIRLLPVPDIGEDPLFLLEERQSGLPAARLLGLGLTKREVEILALVAEGKTDAEIATALWISRRTVEKHLEHVRKKLAVSTRTAAAAQVAELRD